MVVFGVRIIGGKGEVGISVFIKLALKFMYMCNLDTHKIENLRIKKDRNNIY